MKKIIFDLNVFSVFKLKFDKGVFELHALTGKLVQNRCGTDSRVVAAHRVPALLVGEKDQNIRLHHVISIRVWQVRRHLPFSGVGSK